MAGLDSETREMILDTLRRYAEDKLTNAYLLELDHNDEFPQEVLAELYDPMRLGLHLLFIPEEYDGLGGGAYDIYRVSELMASIDLGIATGVLATFLGSDPIRVGATEEQKAHWFGRIAEESLLMAYGATEPQAGSDLAAMTTKAVPVEENGDINGLSHHRAQAMDQQRRRGRSLHHPGPGTRGANLVHRRTRSGRLLDWETGRQAWYSRQQYGRLIPRRCFRTCREHGRRGTEGQGLAAGAGGLWVHPPDGRHIWSRCRMGCPKAGDSLFPRPRSGRRHARS